MNTDLEKLLHSAYQGCLADCKANIEHPEKALFQAVKELSKRRLQGRSVPALILLADPCRETALLYFSCDFKEEIQKIHDSADKNALFSIGNRNGISYHYNMEKDFHSLLETLDKYGNSYLPIDIDENCIVGWAMRYYRENPGATKADFLGDIGETSTKLPGELREPRHFKGLITAYQGDTNERFRYLMDCLNDRLAKKELGAFYTPLPYARKAAELVSLAVDRALSAGKKDYVILDRCAGTGNLESALIGLQDKSGDPLISHCIISTYEYFEYKVLQEELGDLVRAILPAGGRGEEFIDGKVRNADAMSEEYAQNELLKAYLEDPDCAVILFENPPYGDSSASENSTAGDRSQKAKTMRKDSYIAKRFKAEIKKYRTMQASSRELSNLFIWSGFHDYLRQPTDSYIVFSPVKYFKSIGLVKNQFFKGYAFNRKHFHATESVISCIWWGYEPSEDDSLSLEIYDIDEKGSLIQLPSKLLVKEVHTTPSRYADLRSFEEDAETTVSCASNGYPIPDYSYKTGRKPIYNPDVIGYMTAINYPINGINYRLTRCNTKSELEQSFGFHLRKDVYLEKLPIWCAKLYPQDNWYERDVYFTTADGGDAYTKDRAFLKSCLIFTCLTNQNKCLSFLGSDGRFYRNELCFDVGLGETIASSDLSKMTLDKKEEMLIEQWSIILSKAKTSENYDPKRNYGVYQITKELNSSKFLSPDLETLRIMLKEYYKSHIAPKMLRYELVK